MNCYFVSCEIARNPSLKGQKVIVGHFDKERKGIVLASSYEAKAFGIKAAMPIIEALRKCPDLIIVEPDMELYGEFSRRFFDYFLSITPLVEPASIDEGFLDVTDVCSPSLIYNLAKTIQKDLLQNLGLPSSIGIAPNKFLAKMASDMKKPLGITVLSKRNIETMLHPLPISEMIGVGKKGLDNFKALGIKTIGDLAHYKDLKLLSDVLGKTNAQSLYAHANGDGSTVVDVSRFTDMSSFSNSQTLEYDEYDTKKMLMYIKILTNVLANRLEKAEVFAHTFTLQIKYFDFKLTSKSKTFSTPTSDSGEIYKIMADLFDELYDTDKPVRLFGVAASKFTKEKQKHRQLTIFDQFDEVEKNKNVDDLLKAINQKFGSDTIKKGIKKEASDNKTSKYDKKWLQDIKRGVENIEK